MSGRGVDEHLLGLMVVADKAGMDLPELFRIVIIYNMPRMKNSATGLSD